MVRIPMVFKANTSFIIHGIHWLNIEIEIEYKMVTTTRVLWRHMLPCDVMYVSSAIQRGWPNDFARTDTLW